MYCHYTIYPFLLYFLLCWSSSLYADDVAQFLQDFKKAVSSSSNKNKKKYKSWNQLYSYSTEQQWLPITNRLLIITFPFSPNKYKLDYAEKEDGCHPRYDDILLFVALNSLVVSS